MCAVVLQVLLQIRGPKEMIFDAKMDLERYPKQQNWNQNDAKLSWVIFKNISCGTGSENFMGRATQIMIMISGAHDNHHNPWVQQKGRFVLIRWTASPYVHIQ